MNLDKIIKCIEEGLSVDAQLLKEAEELHKKFPFTSIFPMIILKGLKENKNVHFDDQLKKLAIQVNDRGILEKYLESEGKIIQTSKEVLDQNEKPQVESKIEETAEIEKQIELTPKEDIDQIKLESAIEKEDTPIDEKLESKPSVIPMEETEKIVAKAAPKTKQEPQKENTAAPIFNEEKVEDSKEDTTELSPETLAIIAEIEKKYGKDTNESIEQGQVEPTLAEHVEDEAESLKKELEESIFTEDTKVEVESIEKKLAWAKASEEEDEDEEEIINFSLEESIKKSSKKQKKKEAKKKKVKKKIKERKEDKHIEETLMSQVESSPFKFKEFKGEDSEYYHLEIDFSDLEPIAYEDNELSDEFEEDQLFDISLGSKKPKEKKKAEKTLLIEKVISQPKTKKVVSKSIQKEVNKNDSSFEKPVKIEVDSKSEMTFLDWLKANKSEEKKSSKTKSTAKREQIIDKFIEDEPSISKGKKEFFSPTRNAKKSLEDDMEIVSETLADLHIYQGSYGKARKLFEKLILKFPEKKSLFAKKLEEISELEKKNK